LKRLLKNPRLKKETIIIKPNWVGIDSAYGFTESEGLRMLLEALDGRIVVTESYSLGRGPPNDGMSFTVGGEKVSWKWLFSGKGWRWLEKQPDWDWFKEEGHWDCIRKRDKWFLEEYGFIDLFNDHGVRYVNVTEEIWQGRVADPQEVKKVVEDRLSPVFNERLYSLVPQKLYELRGATFISFAKLKNPNKNIISFTVKNFFGLLPDPLRAWWHQWFDSSLIGIIKIYKSLFDVYGICEGLCYAPLYDAKRKRVRVAKDLGVLAFGRHLTLLDAVLCGLVGGFSPGEFSWYSYLEPTGPLKEVFGTYERTHVEKAKAVAADWFPS